jgi:PIN domain nuclease of toxin-antitoxin system
VRILLDTQAIIWFNLEDSRLSDVARAMIQDVDNSVLISPASYWEIAIKISRGKLKIEISYEELWEIGTENNGFGIHHIQIYHTSQLIRLPFHHSDPFDRLLISQSLADDIPIVSSDSILDSYGIKRIW